MWVIDFRDTFNEVSNIHYQVFIGIYWFICIFLLEETAIPANWKPVFRMPETSLILLTCYRLVSMAFVKPLPRKRCEAGLTNAIDTSKIFKAEISCLISGFL